MFEQFDIYAAFRKAQAEFKNRGYRLPKDFSKTLAKMSEQNKKALSKATDFFNTKWTNIDPYEYFSVGFKVYKTFTYINFFDEKVMKLYKIEDKNRKREMRVTKASLKKSLIWVKDYMEENDIKSIRDYCRMKDGNVSVITKHYTSNRIDKMFVVYLIDKGVLRLTDSDRALMPYVVEQYRECLMKIKEMKDV